MNFRLTRLSMISSMRLIKAEVARRRTFAIISHPDAGKTTLTEKLLLYGGAIRQAGSVKAVNLALLGKLSRHFDFTEEQWLDTISTSVPEKFIEMNRKAFLLGRNS